MPRALPIATSRVSVAAPCSENWDQMRGNDTIRFCSHCAKDVHNLVGLKKSEIEQRVGELVARSDGRLCVRYHSSHTGHPRGIDEGPRFVITRRPLRMAAVSLSAVLAASTATPQAYAQDRAAVTAQIPSSDSSHTSAIGGVVTDPSGAVIQGAEVVIVGSDGSGESTVSNAEGRFQFENIRNQAYEVKVEAPGFAQATTTVGTLDGEMVDVSISCSPSALGEVVLVGGALAVTSPIDELIFHYGDRYEERQAMLEEARRLNPNAEIDESDEFSAEYFPYIVQMGERDAVKKALSTQFVDACNEYYETALMLAAHDSEMVKLLLDHRASVESKSRYGVTPLMYSLRDSSNESLAMMIKAGGDVNVQDEDGVTALMIAAIDGNADAVRMLLKAGADPRAVDSSGATVMGYAEKTDNEDVSKLIRAALRKK